MLHTPVAPRSVVGVDFSHNASRGAHWGALEANDRGLHCTLVHALGLPGAVGELAELPSYVKTHRVQAKSCWPRPATPYQNSTLTWP
jgi:hypothetical protein